MNTSFIQFYVDACVICGWNVLGECKHVNVVAEVDQVELAVEKMVTDQNLTHNHIYTSYIFIKLCVAGEQLYRFSVVDAHNVVLHHTITWENVLSLSI